jgi:predicted porin
MAVKVAADFSGVNVFAAYSDADEDGVLGFANLSTADKTKIYTGTGSIYMDGVVTAPGASTYKIGASTKVGDVKLAASYADASDVNNAGDLSAWDVKASTNVAGLGLTAIYTQMSNDTDTGSGIFSEADIETLRIVATVKF